MPYYDTIDEDLARAKRILDNGTIYGADIYAAYKLLESFVAEIERLNERLTIALSAAGFPGEPTGAADDRPS